MEFAQGDAAASRFSSDRICRRLLANNGALIFAGFRKNQKYQMIAIYTLMHIPSGHFYIGSTRYFEKRSSAWMAGLVRDLHWCPNGIWRKGCMLPRTFFQFPWQPREWRIFIIESFSNTVTDTVLSERELFHLNQARLKAGKLCLNKSSNTKRI